MKNLISTNNRLELILNDKDCSLLNVDSVVDKDILPINVSFMEMIS